MPERRVVNQANGPMPQAEGWKASRLAWPEITYYRLLPRLQAFSTTRT